MTAYFLICLSWTLFGAFHSITATNWFKNLCFRYVPHCYYRLLYNGLALFTFIPVVQTLRLAPAEPIGDWIGSVWIGGYLLAVGAFISFIALRKYDLAEFIGWPVDHQTAAHNQLQQSGLFGYVRHPLYLGALVGLAGLIALQPYWKHILFSLAAFGYIRIGIFYEERKLIATFGRQYLQYQQRVPMLVPTF
ncbi:methyltransferase family protein [Spirosoma fluviale]|uniref:Protein-S-isoprenylcysteine O-methyltransferase Ste14 n=1 Tax=Spirosoma fluviale TaxID=1597977 RepID=A0A286FF32_9BACT|nr:isoprenylcysteine carboxylmethyltransferase family protein [Spirosoma fluviale]SOD81589.1 Protein-S-isoprenylcysteine O-methyltransferase Ste14 [Spirosoma fluviale]